MGLFSKGLYKQYSIYNTLRRDIRPESIIDTCTTTRIKIERDQTANIYRR